MTLTPFGTINRFVHATQGFTNEDDTVPGLSRLTINGQPPFFYNQNTPVPGGWYTQRFYELSGNETFKVVP